jgi:predicted aspartyl protease
MRNSRPLKVAVCGVSALLFGFAQTPAGADYKALFAARDWQGLQTAFDHSKREAPLYRAAYSIAFHQDSRGVERMLRSVIKAAPHSEDAYRAYEQLSHLYLRTGQYRRLMDAMEARWANFPEKKDDRRNEESSLGAFRGLPDQTIEHAEASAVPHERDSIFIPASINGQAVTYFFDTGAAFSVVSESEAKRLGLSINDIASTSHTMTSDASFRMAVAKEVRIGGTVFRNVSFGVLPDAREPFSGLPSGRRGVIGIPLIVGLRTLHWVRNGNLEIGQASKPFDLARSNLYFDDDHLVVTSTFRAQKVLATLDTGAETTDLLSGFARQFAGFLAENGTKATREIRGVGGAASYDAVTVPEVSLRIGNMETYLKPAQVITNEAGAKCCAGNFGMDLLKQGRAFRIDFGAMRIEMEPQ